MTMRKSEETKGSHGMVKHSFRDHIDLAEATMKTLSEEIEQAGHIMTACFSKGGKALLFGNGGSAADALHLEGELLGRFRKERAGLPAIALGGGISALTAVANDYDFDAAFPRLARAHALAGDVVLLFSTSGDSPGIVATAEVCRDRGAIAIGLTGRTGGRLRDQVDLLINVPSTDTPRIQEMHILIGHILCEMVEDRLHAA
jgi:D-sedoheptulose 7-phosphate isomerase